ncbi:MAG: hypothetical protein MN733_29920 [Nitrososphaera sp.]|nr:hypothetical protein [Nitrososphaera sp.]
MTLKTKAETIFEEFCNSNNIRWEKIPEGARPTPDFRVVLNGEVIFVEVKQIDEDDDFTEVSGSRIVGDHVRAKIKKARRQAKAASNQVAPAILLIYNNLDPFQMFGTEQHDFTTAMYGEITLVLNPRENRVTESYHGRNQSFREDKNTSLSAVGGIYQTKKGPTVLIYENVFAKHRLNFSSLPDCVKAVRIELV